MSKPKNAKSPSHNQYCNKAGAYPRSHPCLACQQAYKQSLEPQVAGEPLPEGGAMSIQEWQPMWIECNRCGHNSKGVKSSGETPPGWISRTTRVGHGIGIKTGHICPTCVYTLVWAAIEQEAANVDE